MKVQKLNFEAPSKKIELIIAAEMEAVVGGLIQLYIKQRFDVVLRLIELRKWPGGVDWQGLAHEGPKIEF